jgi:hypothetical protein
MATNRTGSNRERHVALAEAERDDVEALALLPLAGQDLVIRRVKETVDNATGELRDIPF